MKFGGMNSQLKSFTNIKNNENLFAPQTQNQTTNIFNQTPMNSSNIGGGWMNSGQNQLFQNVPMDTKNIWNSPQNSFTNNSPNIFAGTSNSGPPAGINPSMMQPTK
jgi:hypothetical protein